MWAWRVEAWRSGRSFAEIAARESLVYRVEQLFLLHRETNRWLLHVADPAVAENAADAAALLREIEELAQTFFFTGDERAVEEFPFDDREVWIAPGPHAHLAAIIRGRAPAEFRAELQTTIAQIHAEHAAALANFAGDTSAFEAAAPTLASCLRSASRPIPEWPRMRVSKRAAAVILAGAVVLGAFVFARDHRPAKDVRGAVAPSVASRALPASTATATAIPRALMQSESERALEQFKAAFPPPSTIKAVVANKTLILSGKAPYEWVGPVRDGATKIPGIDAINGDDLVVEFDPALVLQRFREQFGVPEGAEASMQSGRLILAGDAPHKWLVRVRRGAMDVAGVRVLDDRKVKDVEQRAFEEMKGEIEETSIPFVLSRDKLSTETIAKVTALADEMRRCLKAASEMEVNMRFELRGYGDALASETENMRLSRSRAETMRDALVSNGVEAATIDSLGMGSPPPPAPGEKTGAGRFDRRVFFRIAIEP